MLALEKNIHDFSKRSQDYVKELRENNIARRNFFSLLIIGFILLMLLVYLLDESYKGKKTTISVISIACFFFMGYLQYQNSRDKAAIQNKNPYASFSQQRSRGVFQPESEKRTRELFQSTHDQLSSSKKSFHAPRYGSSYKYDDNSRRSNDYGGIGHQHQPDVSTNIRNTETYSEPNSSYNSNSDFPGVRDRFAGNQASSSERGTREKSLKELQVPINRRNRNERQEQHQSQISSHPSTYERQRSLMRNDSSIRNSTCSRDSHHYTHFDGRDRKDGPKFDYVAYIERYRNTLRTQFKNTTEDDFNKAISSCKNYIMQNVIDVIRRENIENIERLNGLVGNFNKRLYEYECLLKLKREGKVEPTNLKANYTTIFVDDLISHIESVKNNGPMWDTNEFDPAVINETYRAIDKALIKRRYLDEFFKIRGYNLQEIRGYITERLLNLKDPIAVSDYPSDKRIIASIFFSYLHDIANQKKKEFYHFVLRGDNLIYEEKEKGKWFIESFKEKVSEQFVFFIENNLSEHEVHYDILSGYEVWAAKPGPDNLYSAIVMFAKHFRDNSPTVLGIEKEKIFEDFLKGVGAKEVLGA